MPDHFSILAPFYERLIPPPRHGGALLEELLCLSPASVLLDAAGGTGRVSTLFVPKVRQVVLCDTAPGMLKQACGRGIECVAAPVECMPFEDDRFDAILLVDAFHHLEDQRRSIAELLRVLKPGGCLVIEEPDIHRFPVRVVAFLEKATLMRSNFVSCETMIDWIEESGGFARLSRRDRFRFWLTVSKR